MTITGRFLERWIRAGPARRALRGRGAAGLGRRRARLRASLVESEGRIDVRHERGVGDDAEDPPVQSDDEVEDPPWIARPEEQRDRREECEEDDEAGPAAPAPILVPPSVP